MNTFTFSDTPDLTPSIVKKSKFSINKFSAYYLNNGEKMPLQVEQEKSVIFTDEYSMWSIEDSGLNIVLDGSIKQIQYLFSSLGVARPGDILGLAVRVSSSASRQRMIFGSYNYTITHDMDTIDFSCLVCIPPGKLRIKATMDVILYVKDSLIGTPTGRRLGIMKSYTLAFAGDGSLFPIDTESVDEPYLWKLEMLYEDIHSDLFSECVRILINSKNPNFGQLHFDKDPMKSGLFIELITNATVEMIQRAKEDPCFTDVINNVGLQEGSIGQVIYEIIEGYVKRYDSISDIHYWVQKKVYDLMGGNKNAVD